MENKSIALVITAFFMLILGVSILTPTADTIAGKTTKVSVVNEAINLATARLPGSGQINITLSNYTIANVPNGWKLDDCLVSGIVYGNSTDDYTLDTDYKFYNPGTLQILNSTNTDGGTTNTTLLDYTYCADDYLNSQWQRTVTNLVPGFFAITLLLISVGLFYQVAKNEGIISGI
jgi:hypothetical protein